MSRKKKEISVPGLPEPWKAYYSRKRNRIFYFNTITKETSWELPAMEQSSSLPSVPKTEAEEHQQIPNSSKKRRARKKKKSTNPEEKALSQSSSVTVTKEPVDGSCVPCVSKPTEELMEIDEFTMEEISNNEEPMEIDFVVGEVQAFRRDHFLCPDFLSEDPAAVANSTDYVGACGTSRSDGAIVIVFDTSCLLQDTTLLPRSIQRLYHAVIPYTVLRELDGLKKARSEELKLKAIKTNAFLHECMKHGCDYLHIENTFEASYGMEEFGCQNNDEIILKCAYVTTKRCENEAITAVFATNDKLLAVKAAAHNIATADRNELLQLLTKKSSETAASMKNVERSKKKEMSPSEFSFAECSKRVISPSEFSFAVAVKPASSATPDKVQNLPVSFECHLSPASVRQEVPMKNVSSQRIAANTSSTMTASVNSSQTPFCAPLRRKKVSSVACPTAAPNLPLEVPEMTVSKGLKTSEKDSGVSRFRKKRKLDELSGHSLDDFLETLAGLVKSLLQRRYEVKSVEDARKLHKVIDSVISNKASALSVLIDLVSKFYDFYSNRDVFISATHFDKTMLTKEFSETKNEVVGKLRSFQTQLLDS